VADLGDDACPGKAADDAEDGKPVIADTRLD
jgi:hypothetical protein